MQILPGPTTLSMPYGAAQIKEQTVVGQFACAAGLFAMLQAA